MLLTERHKNKSFLVGDGVLDVPQAGNIITEVMTLRSTLFSITEININIVIYVIRDVGDAIPYKLTATAEPQRKSAVTVLILEI